MRIAGRNEEKWHSNKENGRDDSEQENKTEEHR